MYDYGYLNYKNRCNAFISRRYTPVRKKVKVKKLTTLNKNTNIIGDNNE